MIRFLGAYFGLAIFAAFLALPATARASNCYAFVEGVPGVRYAALGPLAQAAEEVTITFVDHSTFRIETPGGAVIATDYYGATGPGRLPDVVTMNKAHSTHYTDRPDPGIPHVLRGWNPDGGPAEHLVELDDVVIRNVTTDIRGWGRPERDGNSIFVFEVADLCIAHLGHLHHVLSDEHLGKLGVIDVLLVPVDGGYTMSHERMVAVIEQINPSLVIPMHYFAPSNLARFLELLGPRWEAVHRETPTVTVSRLTLPYGKVLVLPGS